jgi:hypothetical protein
MSLCIGYLQPLPAAHAASVAIDNIPEWQNSYNNNGTDGEAYIDQTVAHSGSASLKIVNRTPVTPNVFMAFKQFVPVKASTQYQVSLWVKGLNVSRVGIMQDTSWSLRKTLPNGSYDWQQISFTITTDAEMTSFPFIILSDGLTDGLWIDDLTMTEIGRGENLIKNWGFEMLNPAAAVTASVPSGTVTRDTYVELATSTVTASVYYTLDRSEPRLSPTTQLYTGEPIRIDHSLTLKAVASKVGYANSPVSSFEYNVSIGAEGETLLEQEAFYANLSSGKGVPVFYAEGISIDGNLEEWSAASYLDLPGSVSSQNNVTGWSGANDLSGRVFLAYDNENLYMATRVKDNIHTSYAGATMWSGDSIQFASGTNSLFGPEYGFADVNGQPEVWCWNKGDAELDLSAIQLKTVRTADETVYEAKLPWKALHKDKPGASMPFNLIINDNDGSGRKGWIEWTPGIAKVKDQFSFGNLFFIPPDRSWGAWLDRDYSQVDANRSVAEIDEQVPFSLYLDNRQDTAVTYRLDSAFFPTGSSEVTIPAHTVLRKQFTAVYGVTGTQKAEVEVTNLSTLESASAEWSLEVLPGRSELTASLDELSAMLPGLQALLEEVKAKGIPVDYEAVDVAVIEKFIPYGKEDVINNRLNRAQYIVDQLKQLYASAESRLQDNLAGVKVPPSVPRYKTGEVRIRDYSFVSDYTDPQTGVTEERPAFFTGYGHFNQVKKDVPQLSEFGTNIIQVETKPNQILLPLDTLTGWSKGTYGSANVTMLPETDDVHEGQRALRIVNKTPKASNVYGSIWQGITVKPNTKYRFSLWAKGSNVNNAWFGTFTARTQLPSRTYDWQQVTAEYMTGSMETYIDFRILSENVTDQLLVDDVQVTEAGSSVNLLQSPGFEIEDSVVKEDYIISLSAIKNDIQKVLQSAEDNDQAVSLLLSPHYFPASVLAKYPEMKSNNTGFIKFNFNHPKARQVMEDYLRTLIPMVKDYKSLHNLVLSNEPVYTSYKDPFQAEPWHRYLERIYGGRIDELNHRYSTSYVSFDAVPMPTKEERTSLYYDWMNFNDQLFADWHRWMADLVHEMAPDIPVHVKFMGADLMKSQLTKAPLSWGIDPEQMAEFTQISGLDSWNFLYDLGGTLQEKLKFYDLLASYKKAPIFNSEDHVIPDRDNRYVPEQAKHVLTDLWQGAIHGRSASTIWVWERTTDVTSDLEGSILNRPDVVAVVGKTNLDLNRLAEQVTAFQKEPAEAAILYSRTSSMYRPAHLDAVDRAYSALTYSGVKVGFVSEKQIAQGGLSEMKLLIVPDARNVDVSTIAGIRTFMEAGGTVQLIGADSLTRDPYNSFHQTTGDLDYIRSHAMVVPVEGTADKLNSPTAAQSKEALLPHLRQIGLVQAEVVDSVTNQSASDVEWRTVEWNGRLLLNAANYSWTPKQINIMLNGVVVQSAEELIRGEAVSAMNMTLQPYTPVLLDLGEVQPQEKPNWISIELDSQAYSLKVDTTRKTILTALYDDGSWKEVNTGIAYSVQDPNVAVVDGSGVIHGLRAGQTMLSAVYGTFKATATITVESNQPESGGGSDESVSHGIGSQKPGTLDLAAGASGQVALGDEITVLIPEGATNAKLRITVEKLAERGRYAVDEPTRISPVYEILKDVAGRFLKPVQITLSFNPFEIQEGQKASVFFLDEDKHKWMEIGGDVNGSRITVFVDHFAKFAVFSVDQSLKMEPGEKVVSLSDIGAHWAKDQIMEGVKRSIIEGYEDGTFRPDNKVTREEFAAMLVRSMKPALADGITRFSDDMKIRSWAKSSISAAVKAGWLQGYPDGTFRPQVEITRSEVAVILVRVLGIINELKVSSPFADSYLIPDWAKSEIEVAVTHGLLKGKGMNLFDGNASATRAETTVVLLRMLQL